MPLISTGDLRKGAVIELEGQLLAIMDYEHIKMGRGSAQVRIKFRNIRTGAITERTFQAGSKWPRVRLENKTVQYLYNDDGNYYFMDQETFDQIVLNASQLGDAVNYLKENLTLDVLFYENEPVSVELPITVDLKVTDTEPGFRGDTATGGSKPATTETGLVVQVPLFVNVGDVIRVDTRSGAYLTRVSERG
jgi:elongation factor P